MSSSPPQQDLNLQTSSDRIRMSSLIQYEEGRDAVIGFYNDREDAMLLTPKSSGGSPTKAAPLLLATPSSHHHHHHHHNSVIVMDDSEDEMSSSPSAGKRLKRWTTLSPPPLKPVPCKDMKTVTAKNALISDGDSPTTRSLFLPPLSVNHVNGLYRHQHEGPSSSSSTLLTLPSLAPSLRFRLRQRTTSSSSIGFDGSDQTRSLDGYPVFLASSATTVTTPSSFISASSGGLFVFSRGTMVAPSSSGRGRLISYDNENNNNNGINNINMMMYDANDVISTSVATVDYTSDYDDYDEELINLNRMDF